MEKQIVFRPDTLQYLTHIRQILQRLPAVEEYLCFATPAFRVKKKLLARLQDDGLTLSVHADDRDIWIAQNPEAFFVTPHFLNYPTVLVKLNVVPKQLLKQVLFKGWQEIAPKSILKMYQG